MESNNAKTLAAEADEQTMPYDIDVSIAKHGRSSPTDSSSTTIDDPPVDGNQSTSFNLAMSDVSEDKVKTKGKADIIEPTVAYNMCDDDDETDDDATADYMDPTVPYDIDVEDDVCSITSDKKNAENKQSTINKVEDDLYALDTDEELERLENGSRTNVVTSDPPVAFVRESFGEDSEIMTKRKHKRPAILHSEEEMETDPLESPSKRPEDDEEKSPILTGSQNEKINVSEKDSHSSKSELIANEDKEIAQQDVSSTSSDGHATKSTRTRVSPQLTGTEEMDAASSEIGSVSKDVSDSEEQSNANATKKTRGKKKAKTTRKTATGKGKRTTRGKPKAEPSSAKSFTGDNEGDDSDSMKMEVEQEIKTLKTQSSTAACLLEPHDVMDSSPKKKSTTEKESTTTNKDVGIRSDKVPTISLARVRGESKLVIACIMVTYALQVVKVESVHLTHMMLLSAVQLLKVP